MDPYSYLGREFECPGCGRTHAVRLADVAVAPDAFDVLPGLCRKHARGSSVCLLADVRTADVAGSAAAARLTDAGFRVRSVIVPDPGPASSPVCDDRTHDALASRITAVPGLFVAVGSGVVSDLTKWLAADSGTPYVAFATAASMNGYASANVAPTIDGVKRLVRGRGPMAIVTSPAVLAAAPAAMTAAGLGDVIAKGVSAADWKLNQLLFDEYYCPLCVGLVRDLEPQYTEHPEDVRAGLEPAIRALFDALILTGVAMTIAGTSSPASGGEHLISHTLDMKATVDGTSHDLHGRQVGVGTILCAALYHEVMTLEQPVFRVTDEPVDSVYWGRLTPAVEPEHVGKQARAAAAVDVLQCSPALWDSVRTEIGSAVPAPARVKQCLERAGAAHTVADLGVTRERFIDALTHAHQMRTRYTILDLARAVGILPHRAGDLVDAWLV